MTNLREKRALDPRAAIERTRKANIKIERQRKRWR